MGDGIQNYNVDTMKEEIQKILRIQDWDIELSFASGDSFYRVHDRDDVKGHCHRDRSEGTADIVINRSHPHHSTPMGTPIEPGWLPTLFHEFFHVFTDDYAAISQAAADKADNGDREPYSSQLDIQMENLINRMSRLTLQLIDVPAFLDRHRKDETNGSTTKTAE